MNRKCSITQLDRFLYELKLVEDDMFFGEYIANPFPSTYSQGDKMYLIKEETNVFLRRNFLKLDGLWEADYLTSHME